MTITKAANRMAKLFFIGFLLCLVSIERCAETEKILRRASIFLKKAERYSMRQNPGRAGAASGKKKSRPPGRRVDIRPPFC